jgi:uncharacterized surface anchored protein
VELVTDSSGNATSEKVLPFGTYELREIEAPEGYQLNSNWVGIATIADSQTPANAGTVDENIERIVFPPVAKVDINLGANGPQGDAVFEGAEVSITNASQKPVGIWR